MAAPKVKGPPGQAGQDRAGACSESLVEDFSTARERWDAEAAAVDAEIDRTRKLQELTRPLSEIDAEPIRWHWPQVLALGKVTLLAGDPGLGKSLLTADITARTTAGHEWPDKSGKPEPSRVIFASAEDDAADTIRPRLEAAGADVDRVQILTTVTALDDDLEIIERAFNLKADLPRLDAELTRLGDCRLVIVDPVSAYLGAVDSHKNAEVRELLAPLAELAARHRVAVLGVSHLNKGTGDNALYRVSGSLAFVAAARASWLVVKDQDDEARRLVLPAKNNLAPDDAGGFAYSIEAVQTPVGTVPVIRWEPERVQVSALDAMADQEFKSARDEAKDFILDMLNEGKNEAREILKQARAVGINEKTLKRAKADLKVKSEKDGFTGKWRWTLSQEGPRDPRPKVSPLTPLGDEEGQEGQKSTGDPLTPLPDSEEFEL